MTNQRKAKPRKTTTSTTIPPKKRKVGIGKKMAEPFISKQEQWRQLNKELGL